MIQRARSARRTTDPERRRSTHRAAWALIAAVAFLAPGPGIAAAHSLPEATTERFQWLFTDASLVGGTVGDGKLTRTLTHPRPDSPIEGSDTPVSGAVFTFSQIGTAGHAAPVLDTEDTSGSALATTGSAVGVVEIIAIVAAVLVVAGLTASVIARRRRVRTGNGAEKSTD